MTNEVFLISDHHFGHSNIIKYENRPFSDVDEMTEHMITKWNETVRKGDKVFVLGDFSFYGKEKTSEILFRLNGIKYLVKGNHDRRRSNRWWLEAGFDKVYDEAILYHNFFILSHEPQYTNNSMPYVNIHGHIHSKKITGARNINVSVEVRDYTPVSFDKIIELVGTGDKDDNE